MQGFTDAPRQAFSRQNILDLIGWAPDASSDVGMEILDNNNNPVLDVSSYLIKDASSKTSRTCTDEIQGTSSYTTEYNHNWGVDRVRPYMLMSCPRLVPNGPARFDLGVFIVTSPTQPLGSSVPIYGVTGYDLVYLLTSIVGYTYSAGAGTTYFQAIRDAITVALAGTPFVLNLDSTKADAVLPNDMSWPMASSSSGTRWLDVVNDLLKAITYRPVWADYTGAYRSEPDIDPATRPIELILGAGDTPQSRYLDADWLAHGIVDNLSERSITRDTWNAPNRWRFVQNDLDFEPVEGSGQYTVDNLSSGPTSQAAVGRVIMAPVQFLDASGQADIVSQGNKIVQDDIYPTETVKFSTARLPIAGHFDMIQLLDPTLPGSTPARNLVAQSWELPWWDGPMNWSTIAATPDTSNWNTGDSQSGGFNAQNPGGGGIGSAWTLPYRPGVTYGAPTPPPPLFTGGS